VGGRIFRLARAVGALADQLGLGRNPQHHLLVPSGCSGRAGSTRPVRACPVDHGRDFGARS
jgi:hypothetical protein